MSFVKLREDAKENDKTTAQQSSLHSVASNSNGKPDVFLGKGTKVVGTLIFSGTTEIDCQIEGEINSKENLIISESAVVNGKIVGGEVTVRGTVNGDIVASKRLSLRRPARVIGNISAANLSIEEGVTFEGKCAMSSTGAAQAPKTGVAA
jgi:cytoskeletal protein CcmA (bactofilin family)